MKYLEYLLTGNVKYCIVHGWQSLPEHLPSDLDIVISPQQLNALERSLASKGRIVQLLQHETSCFCFVLVTWEGDKVRFIRLDAATDYRWNGRVFFAADELLKARRRWNRLWVASPSVEFAYLLVKKVLKGAIPAHQKTRLQELHKALGEKARAIAWRFFGAQWSEQVTSWIAQSDWAPFETHLRTLKHILCWRVMKQDPLNPLRYWIPELGRVWQRWRYPTGLFVAVLGPDGVGKSTLIGHLRKGLAGAFRGTKVFHLRPDVIGQRLTNGPATDPHGKNPRCWWLSLFKIFYYLLDYSLGYLFKVRPRLLHSTLVLFDRYYDDLFVDPRRYRYGGPRWLARIVQRFISRPDLFLVLDLSEEQLLVRKREVSREELRRQREGYRQLSAELPNAVLLDGSLAAEEVARNASEVILAYLHQRYLKRRYIWFGESSSDILDWLTSVFSADAERVRFVSSNHGRYQRTESQWKTDGSLGWLTLRDGRGYLIPLDSRQAAVNGLTLYNVQSSKARIAKKLLTAGLKYGPGRALLRKVQVLKRLGVPEKPRSVILFLEHLREILGRSNLTFAISLGTPGPHRKPVVQVLSKNGKILGYVKVGWNEATNVLVRNEAEILEVLNRVSLRFKVPRVLYAGEWEGRFFCVESAPEGKVKPAPQGLMSQYLDVVGELAALHTRWRLLKQSTFWTNLLERIENVQSTYYRYILQQGAYRVEEELGDRPLPFHLQHGDFAPWNARQANGQLFLYDWEYAAWEAPAGWDLFHFVAQTLWLLKKWSPYQIYKVFQNNEMEKWWIAEHLKSLGVEKKVLEPLLALYLLERLAFYAVEDPDDFQRLKHFTMLVNLFTFKERLHR